MKVSIFDGCLLRVSERKNLQSNAPMHEMPRSMMGRSITRDEQPLTTLQMQYLLGKSPSRPGREDCRAEWTCVK